MKGESECLGYQNSDNEDAGAAFEENKPGHYIEPITNINNNTGCHQLPEGAG